MTCLVAAVAGFDLGVLFTAASLVIVGRRDRRRRVA
jgi:hypothetical protein